MLQAMTWLRVNAVTDLPEHEALGDGLGPGLHREGRMKAVCAICCPHPVLLNLAAMHSQCALFTNIHCTEHASEFHALPGVETWHCCEPPYHPANLYSWRRENSGQQAD